MPDKLPKSANIVPQSCDTFVALPPATALNCVVFGKNSDRPKGEVQEVVYFPSENHPSGSKVQCTYISIDQVEHTHAVILSKPAWMWGAEMGANDANVCIGNEAVWTKLCGDDDLEERLLGMDLVRLGLERASTAREAVDVITSLLEEHGQGGPCSDTKPDFSYHNSFLIADRKEAWVLETAGRLWAAEHVTSGCRNISNCLTIETKIDLMSKDLKEHAQSNGFWDGQGDLNFAAAYGKENESATSRFERGKELLNKFAASGEFGTLSMFEILRDCEGGICRGLDHEFPTAASQVSSLPHPDSQHSSCHWFTGTPDTAHSVFKPFVFCSTNRISKHIVSPTYPDNEDPAKVKPRFQKQVDRAHTLYNKHQKAYPLITSDNPKGQEIISVLRRLETQCVKDMESFVENFTADKAKEVEDIFKDLVESEMKFYYIK
ncbi:secernin-2-like [Argiope bruennichi]|uniref:Secernin-2 like protein n=1 Tax=Argiope bruennichi TaxID=94029 RepID=A0A8T0FEB6_ARGBR|nr:secernin-2-like [Argiope bruennichi]XP_055924898.1 secernin-2-like [Argiope bruennichi]KAF8788745.1 Secernin-2 like protein [Argiope bruennichi]